MPASTILAGKPRGFQYCVCNWECCPAEKIIEAGKGHTLSSFDERRLKTMLKTVLCIGLDISDYVKNASQYRVSTHHFEDKYKQKRGRGMALLPHGGEKPWPMPRETMAQNLRGLASAPGSGGSGSSGGSTSTSILLPAGIRTRGTGTTQPNLAAIIKNPNSTPLRSPHASRTRTLELKRVLHTVASKEGELSGLIQRLEHELDELRKENSLEKEQYSKDMDMLRRDFQAKAARQRRDDRNRREQEQRQHEEDLKKHEQDLKDMRKELEDVKAKHDEDMDKARKELEKAQRDILNIQNEHAATQAELDDLKKAASGSSLSWGSLHDGSLPFKAAVKDLTGIDSVEILDALYDLFNHDNAAETLLLYRGSESNKERKIAAAARPNRKGRLDPRDGMLATLVKLRTGLSLAVIAVFMGLRVEQVERNFVTWISFMHEFFKVEFPVPTVEEMMGNTAAGWISAYGSDRVRMIIDCSEFKTQAPACLEGLRTLWSDYKQAHTAKILAGITPTGAFAWSSEAFPGRITDPEICLASGFFDVILDKDVVGADRGFDNIARELHALGASVKAPDRRWRNVSTLTSDERAHTEQQSNMRIHVERHFGRVATWGFFSHRKIYLHQADLIGKCFFIVSHLCNLAVPLC